MQGTVFCLQNCSSSFVITCPFLLLADQELQDLEEKTSKEAGFRLHFGGDGSMMWQGVFRADRQADGTSVWSHCGHFAVSTVPMCPPAWQDSSFLFFSMDANYSQIYRRRVASHKVQITMHQAVICLSTVFKLKEFPCRLPLHLAEDACHGSQSASFTLVVHEIFLQISMAGELQTPPLNIYTRAALRAYHGVRHISITEGSTWGLVCLWS